VWVARSAHELAHKNAADRAAGAQARWPWEKLVNTGGTLDDDTDTSLSQRSDDDTQPRFLSVTVPPRIIMSPTSSPVGGVAQWQNVGLWPANFPCPALDLQLMGDH